MAGRSRFCRFFEEIIVIVGVGVVFVGLLWRRRSRIPVWLCVWFVVMFLTMDRSAVVGLFPFTSCWRMVVALFGSSLGKPHKDVVLGYRIFSGNTCLNQFFYRNYWNVSSKADQALLRSGLEAIVGTKIVCRLRSGLRERVLR